MFREQFADRRWTELAARGARLQRPLWASTSTKNPAYPDTLYVDHLIGPDTVNTVPPATLKAYMDHGTVKRTLDVGFDAARAAIMEFADLGLITLTFQATASLLQPVIGIYTDRKPTPYSLACGMGLTLIGLLLLMSLPGIVGPILMRRKLIV